MQSTDYLRDILPAEMRNVVRSFLGTADRIRLACTCTLLAAEDAAFITLPPFLAVNALKHTPTMRGTMRRLMQSFFLDLLSVRHLPEMAWFLSLANDASFTHETIISYSSTNNSPSKRIAEMHSCQVEIGINQAFCIPRTLALTRTVVISADGIETHYSSVKLLDEDALLVGTSEYKEDKFMYSIQDFICGIVEYCSDITDIIDPLGIC